MDTKLIKTMLGLGLLGFAFSAQADDVLCAQLWAEGSSAAEPAECFNYTPDGKVTLTAVPVDPTADTDTAFFGDIRNDRFGTHVLNNFAGQTTLANPDFRSFALSFDETGTTLYGTDVDLVSLVIINQVDGTNQSVVGPLTGLVGAEGPSGIAIAGDGTCYISATDGVNSSLYTCDLTTGAVTLIGTQATTPLLIGIAASCDGTVYGHDIGTDSFYTLSTTDGSATLLGPHGLATNFAQDITYDREAGELYAYLYTGGGTNTFARVNTTDGSITPLSVDNPLGEFVGATQTSCAPAEIDLGINVTAAAPTPIVVGSTIVYTVTASNLSAGAATGVTVVDTLSSNVDYVSNTCGATEAAGVVTWTIGNLAGNSSASCDVTAQVSGFGGITNSATISGDQTDTVTANNASNVTLGGPAQNIPVGAAWALALLAGMMMLVARRRLRI